MHALHRSRLLGIVGLLVALSAVPLTPRAVAASTDYAASCSVQLRASPSISAPVVDVIPTWTVVTATDTVAGDPWSDTCPAPVAGSSWYVVTAVNGTSVSALFGVSALYAPAGLFGPAVYLQGIDVSHWQQAIDWNQVAGAGMRFAMIKATQGQSFLDPLYATNHASARAAGIPVSAYHFADPSTAPNDAVLQADWYATAAALLPGDLVPALDLEATGGLSTTDLQAWVGAWLGEAYAKLGVRPMIYTSPNFWKNYMGDTTMFADQGYAVLWVAHWFVSSPTVPANNWSGHGWTFWQYTDCGSVPGISGCVDLDLYNGLDLSTVTFNYSPTPANPTPVLTGISPTSAPAGGGDLTITIQGANFAPGVSAASWNGTVLATTYVSPTQLTAVVPAALTGTPGDGSIAVANDPPGGGASGSATFAVSIPVAQLSLTPSTTVTSWGQSVALDVQFATLGANRAVTLERMKASETSWSDIATTTADASGRAAFTDTAALNSQYRAVFAGAPDLAGGTSLPIRVVARQILLLRPTYLGQVKRLPVGSRVTFTATVRPIGPTVPRTDVTFAFWRIVDGHWRLLTKRDVDVDVHGRASWTWTFKSRGQWYVRAVANHTTTNATSSWSPLVRYSI